MKRFFVGGPWHGEVHDVLTDSDVYQVAAPKDLPLDFDNVNPLETSIRTFQYSIKRLVVFDRFVEYMAVGGTNDLDLFFDAIVRPELKEFFHEAPEPFRGYTNQRNSGGGRFKLD